MKSKKKTAKKVLKSAKNDVWPLQRKVFFKPERMKYVRKLVKDTGCVFCKSSQMQMSFESLCVFKSKHSQIILNKYPYNNGHLLVIPLQHIGNIMDLSPERYDDLHQTLRLAIEAINTCYAPTGFNVGLNHGSSAGAGIPEHIHYHIVPRWSGDFNFFPLIADAKVVVETLEKSYENFSKYFSGRGE
jgi:ATP adenylyltransferase